MAGTAHHLPAHGSAPADADPALLAAIDVHLADAAARVRAVADLAGPVARDRIRAGLAALLDELQADVDRTWSWVAIWPATGDRELARRIAAVDRLLRGGLEAAGIDGLAAARLVRDGWALVHEHLWVERDADLPGLLGPLMALVVLRSSGPAGVGDALAGARGR